MKLFVDLETLNLIEGPGFRNPVTLLRFKRGDAAKLEVEFLEGGSTAVSIGNPDALEIRFGVKPRNRYDIGYLVQAAAWTMPVADADSPIYQASPSFNTEELNSALGVGSSTGSELSEIALMGEITWREGNGLPTSTRTFQVIVENDVNRGTEGVPAAAEPPYPAAENIITTQNLGTHAVRFDASQALTAPQKQQARDNIGAIGPIADNSLSIAKTAGLQTELDQKLGFRIGLGPDELNSLDSLQALVLEKNGEVWLHKPGAESIPLASSGPQPPPDNQLQAHFESTMAGYSESTTSIQIPAGNYLVTISAANFTTSSWGSHSLAITYDDSIASFSNPSAGSLYNLQVTTGPGILYFFLTDPASAPNPQVGTVNLLLATDQSFCVSGYLPMAGDSVDFTITFTPV